MRRGGKHNAVRYVKKQSPTKESEAPSSVSATDPSAEIIVPVAAPPVSAAAKPEEAAKKPDAPVSLAPLYTSLDTALPESEVKRLSTALLAELAISLSSSSAPKEEEKDKDKDKDKEKKPLVPIPTTDTELPRAVHALIVRLYRLKKSLADPISGILGSYRGIAALREMDEAMLGGLVDIILDVVVQRKIKEERIGCLRLLSYMIYENHRMQGLVERLLDPVVAQCAKIAEDPKVARQAFNCLGNILSQYSELVRPKADSLLNVTLEAFHKVADTFRTEITSHVKEVQTITRCLSYCLAFPKTLSADLLEALFLKLYKLLFLGTPYINLKIFCPKATTPVKPAASTSSSSSGSEISDPEEACVPASAESVNTHDQFGKIRTHVLLCIQHMCRLNDRFMFDKWHLLLPRYVFAAPVATDKEGHSCWALDLDKIKKWSTSTEPNFLLFLGLSKDPKVRLAVASTISAVIDRSPIRTWQGALVWAGTGKKKSSAHAFMGLSEILGNAVVSFHYLLIYYLSTEPDPTVQLQLLKAQSVLLSVTQYQKMPPGLITYTLRETSWRFLTGPTPKPDPIQLLCLNCITSVGNQRVPHPEFEHEFLRTDSPTSIVKFIVGLGTSNKEIGRSMECMVLLAKLCKNYSSALQPYWHELLDYLKAVFKDGVANTTLGCVRFIEEYVKHYNALIYMNPTQSPEKLPPDIFGNKEFVDMLEEIIRAQCVDKFPAAVSDMQTAIMNVFGIMSETQWAKLSAPVVSKAVEFVMGVQGTGMAQSVALKAVGSMVTYGLFSKSHDFVQKTVAKIVANRADTSMLVATKNSWALANLSYCLEGLAKLERYPELGDCALIYARSLKEKVSSNGIRALGYILKKAETKEHFFIGKQPLDSVLQVVVSHLGVKSPKIAWNACVAIGNILTNPSLPRPCLLYSSATFDALLVVIADKPNIKTKIHAIQALQSYRTKEEYGECYVRVLAALLGLNSEIGMMQFEDVTEYKYRDKLETTIIDTVSYMLDLWGTSKSDADSISELFLNQYAGQALGTSVKYLRRLLKISAGEASLSKEEAKALAQTHDSALRKVQTMAAKIAGWVKRSAKAHVSFGVLEQFQEIASTSLDLFHFMQCLAVIRIKAKFSQTFQ